MMLSKDLKPDAVVGVQIGMAWFKARVVAATTVDTVVVVEGTSKPRTIPLTQVRTVEEMERLSAPGKRRGFLGEQG